MLKDFYDFFRFRTYVEGADKKVVDADLIKTLQLFANEAILSGEYKLEIIVKESNRKLNANEYQIILSDAPYTGFSSHFNPYTCITFPSMTEDVIINILQTSESHVNNGAIASQIFQMPRDLVHYAIRDSFFIHNKYAHRMRRGHSSYGTSDGFLLSPSDRVNGVKAAHKFQQMLADAWND